MCVNALYRAFSISIVMKIYREQIYQECVNALHRAYSISTSFELISGKKSKGVSMPFIGLTPFLHYFAMQIRNELVCQCPLSGLLHFYMTMKKPLSNLGAWCQCPSSGFLHFYCTLSEHA